ncbi:MAG TPA: NAD(P)H-dependent oxidoreductase subunit E [Steroidobacteraceae bacterium]|nr:NAD(P)H-dependent oxidoreductase subunit E [Steroidobacteraceae bacterium]HQR49639.1 NAD(P)H-dependent oxidoreductase subunit E [Steroidobacteraceae bacterium]
MSQAAQQAPDVDALVRASVARWRHEPTRLLQVLREVQEACNYIPPPALTLIAHLLRLPLSRVKGVAGFYSFLSTEPWGRYRVLFSDNVTDRMHGSERLLAEMCHRLWVEAGKVSEDGLVSVATTSCTGLCDQGPGMLVNGRAIGRLTSERVEQICGLILRGVPLDEWPAALFHVDDNVRRADIMLGHRLQPGDAVRAALRRGVQGHVEHAANARSWREGFTGSANGPVAVLEEVKRSNLRGRGGAGFTTGIKWEACRHATGNARYVICNADEGEPGTFKDRVLLTSHADLLFDGMTVAAYAVGASQGFVYLRGEYRFLLDRLNETLERRRRDHLLGNAICGQPGFDFDIEIHVGAGSYVCGEESALIESLEGKRGVPRNRPPFPVTSGYLQQPTIVNNVETLCAAALIAVRGGEWYRSIGTLKSSGTKILSVAGDCDRPGLYEYPFGVTLRQVLEECGATRTQAVQVSGPSGTCVDAGEFDRRIAFEDLPTAGAFTVFDTSRDMFEIARAYAQFFAHESCGFCTPCRAGTSMLMHSMDKIRDGNGTLHDLREIARLNKVLLMSAHCGLGHTACNPILDTMKKFRPVYERRLRSRDFAPAFDLDEALARARQMTGRDDPGAHLENLP